METPGQSPSPRVLDLLTADGPYAAYADQLMLYGQFIGSWDIHSTSFQADGTQTEEWQGEWHFAWILGGLGVQDVLLITGTPAHEYGTTLRCYDEAHEVWHVSYMAPGAKEFAHLVGRRSGEQIVQEVTGPNPHRFARWIFSDITPTTFTWRGEVSSDQGKTWTLVHEMRAVRRMAK